MDIDHDLIGKLYYPLCVAKDDLFLKDSRVGYESNRAIWRELRMTHKHIRINRLW